MAFLVDQETNELVISGWENGIAHSPYTGIANIQGLNTSNYPGVAYLNYRRQASTFTGGAWFAGAHSVNVSDNSGWIFTASTGSESMGNPVQDAHSPAGLNYVLDSLGQVWKQNSVNSSSWTKIEGGSGRFTNGNGGLAYWENYIVVFGDSVIEFCGDGTGDSTITSANWNLSTSTFIITATTFTPQEFQLSGTLMTGATSATLANPNYYYSSPSGSSTWQYDTNSSATFIFSNGDVRTGTVTNLSSGISWTGGLSSNVSTLVFISSPYVQTQTDLGIAAGQQLTFSSTVTLPSPLISGEIYYATNSSVGLNSDSAFIFPISQTTGGSNLTMNSLGSGTLTVNTVAQTTLPIGNVTNLTFTDPLSAGITTATISSYTLPNGTTVNAEWLLPSLLYNVIDSNGNQILTQFNFGSSTVSFTSPVIEYATGNFQVNLLNPAVSSYRAYVSKVDSNLYFANGQFVGKLQAPFGSSVLFNPANPNSYSVYYGAFSVPNPQEIIVDMVDLQNNQIVAGQRSIYVWDYVSSQTQAPVPIGEPIVRIINLLNNIYITAGQKGNLYTSNGAYAQLLTKIPDYISGVIDPVWTFGGMMTHRGKIYFQAQAQNTSGTNLMAGVFSLIVSPSVLGEVAGGINVEAQNSYGLIPTSGSTGAGILMDDEPSSNGQDSYYSVYSTGASTGGIDYNDTTVWQNFEAFIESDLIPLGSILNKKTLGQIQFKLDRPMASGDEIKISWRPSIGGSYTVLGTTTTQVLSDYYSSTISQQQWVQFKIQFSGASSGTSFTCLKEIRFQTT